MCVCAHACVSEREGASERARALRDQVPRRGLGPGTWRSNTGGSPERCVQHQSKATTVRNVL